MRKFPYTIDVKYASGRDEVIKITTSQQEASVKTRLDHMKVNGLVDDWRRRKG